MADSITIDDQCFWVSSSQLMTLVEFGIAIGRETATNSSERQWVDKLDQWHDGMWPGIGMDLAERFPTLAEQKFWAACFANVARRIFLRELGNQKVVCWQARTIGHAHLISRLLTKAVQLKEGAWHPDTEDSEAYGKVNNLRL